MQNSGYIKEFVFYKNSLVCTVLLCNNHIMNAAPFIITDTAYAVLHFAGQ